ncbi:MAG: hypothetical protein HYV09_19345 [Deltaproteobacteria bacterium]|nr:hypothetical protein [Deltaproteobacteria bacterium]
MIELVAEDDGPCFADVDSALRDSVSEGIDLAAAEPRPSRPGLGTGLGAILRLMGSLTIERREGGVVARRPLAPRYRRIRPGSNGDETRIEHRAANAELGLLLGVLYRLDSATARAVGGGAGAADDRALDRERFERHDAHLGRALDQRLAHDGLLGSERGDLDAIAAGVVDPHALGGGGAEIDAAVRTGDREGAHHAAGHGQGRFVAGAPELHASAPPTRPLQQESRAPVEHADLGVSAAQRPHDD